VNASNVKTGCLPSFDALNQEFTKFRKYKYDVFPAEQAHSHSQKRNELYDKENPKGKHPNQAYVEVPAKEASQQGPTLISKGSPTSSKHNQLCTPSPEDQPGVAKQPISILKWDVQLPNEDIVMGDGSPTNPRVHVPLDL
jgi:hypothetical protein